MFNFEFSACHFHTILRYMKAACRPFVRRSRATARENLIKSSHALAFHFSMCYNGLAVALKYLSLV
jgi:hypothetical protein